MVPDDKEVLRCKQYASSEESVVDQPVNDGRRAKYHDSTCINIGAFLKANRGLEFYVSPRDFSVVRGALYLTKYSTELAAPEKPRHPLNIFASSLDVNDVKITLGKDKFKAEGQYIDASSRAKKAKPHWIRIDTVKAVEIKQ